MSHSESATCWPSIDSIKRTNFLCAVCWYIFEMRAETPKLSFSPYVAGGCLSAPVESRSHAPIVREVDHLCGETVVQLT